MRTKRSPIWKIEKTDLEVLVRTNTSLAGVLSYFGLTTAGGNVRTLRSRLDVEEIDYSHIPKGRGCNKGRSSPGRQKKIPLEQVLVVDSTYSRFHLKSRLLKDGLLNNKCSKCEQKPIWNSLPLVMVLDHINGVRNDNRIENLRLLCPNCNGQTDTFCGRRKRYK